MCAMEGGIYDYKYHLSDSKKATNLMVNIGYAAGGIAFNLIFTAGAGFFFGAAAVTGPAGFAVAVLAGVVYTQLIKQDQMQDAVNSLD